VSRANPALVDLVGNLIADGPDDRPPLIAVVGAQGSGKTTRAGREAMSRDVHPLFLMRGPPGTHDLDLLQRLIDALSAAGPEDETLIPDFDKRGDDRRPVEDWRVFRGRPSTILIDAWCLGALPQEATGLAQSVNALEADQDPDGGWRKAVNGFVGGTYSDFVARFDAVLFLKAPSFDVVLDWRCQQEADLLGVAPADLPLAERERLAGFIQYFERITRHMLDGGVRADVVVQLDRNRLPGSIAP
jgi:D-glycerate 3-kinase